MTGASQLIRNNRAFVRYWAGHAISDFGDQISALALPLIASKTLDASERQVGLLTAAVWTPHLISLFVGTWADRVARARTVLVLANFAQAAAVVAVPVAWAIGVLSMPVLYVAALALGIGGVVFDTSYMRFFVRVVKREHYVDANSVLSTTRSISGIAGPAVGGALIQIVTAPVAMVVDAASFVVSAAMIRTVREPQLDSEVTAGPEPVQQESYLRRLRAGTSYLVGNRYLRASLASSAIMNLVAFAVQPLLIVFATRKLSLNAGQIGLAFGLGGVGALVGAALAGSCAAALGTGKTIAIGALAYTLPFSILAGARPGLHGLVVIAGVEALSGFGVMLFDINNNAMRTAVTRDEMRSRVAGAYSTVNYGARPLGAVVGGTIGGWLGIAPTLRAAGLVGLLAVVSIVVSPIMKVRSIPDLRAQP